MSGAEVRLIQSDCLVEMASLPDSSVGLIIADPPYHRVKDETWDRRWKTDADYLDWIGRLCGEWRRVLKPNGSLYVFASPRMAARVECRVGESFEVLNQIVWDKGDGSGAEKGARGGLTRSYIYQTERIVFAEQPLSRTVDYLRRECREAGVTPAGLSALLGYKETNGSIGPRRYLSVNGFAPMSRENYARLQEATGRFRLPYDDLYRPFSVDSSVPYTDVWDFPTVSHRLGKHPCQKPEELISHIIRASSRPGDLVLDPFAGSGVTGRACLALGRPAVLIEEDPAWCGRIAAMLGEGESADTPLFSGLAS